MQLKVFLPGYSTFMVCEHDTDFENANYLTSTTKFSLMKFIIFYSVLGK